MEHEFQYADAGPYPPIEVSGPNQVYARAMLANIGSGNSEMSAVSLYFYNSVILKERFPDASKCFHHISIVEMHHLDIFSQLACKLGADPRLWSRTNSRPVYWSPSYNRYLKAIGPLIQNAISGEQKTIAQYRQQANWIKDPHIVEMLHRIILDEEHHIEIFRTLYQEFCQ